MASSYVRFLKGTPAAYKSAIDGNNINENTLYFISEKDATYGKLYIGNKLIANGDQLRCSLKELTDVIADNATTDSFLVYTDGETWEVKSASEVANMLITEMRGASLEQNGLRGVVPAPLAGQQDLFLKGDGTWSKPKGVSKEEIKQKAVETLNDVFLSNEIQNKQLNSLKEISSWLQVQPNQMIEMTKLVKNLNNIVYGNSEKNINGEIIPTQNSLINKMNDVIASLIWSDF